MASATLNIIAANLIDDYATLSSSAVFAEDYPLSNLKITGRNYYTATSGTQDLTITINLAHAVDTASSALALIGDFSLSASLSLAAYSGENGTGTTLFAQPLTPIKSGFGLSATDYKKQAQPFFFVKTESGIGNMRSMVMVIRDSSNPIGSHHLHRLVFGECFSPDYTYRFSDNSMNYVHDAAAENDQRGNLHFREAPAYREFSFSGKYYSLHEVMQMLRHFRYSGKNRDIFAMLRGSKVGAEYLEYGMLCRVNSDFSFKPTSYSKFSMSFDLVESLGART